MSEDDLRRLAKGLAPPDCSQPFGVYVFRPDQPEAALPLHIEQVVFEEAFGNSPELLAAEYGPYDFASLLLCVVDHRRRLPAGMMRIIVPSNSALKSLHDITAVWGVPFTELYRRTSIQFLPESTWDMATLAVAPGYRGVAASGLVSMALYQALSIVSERCGVEHLVAILHLPVLRMIQWKFHKPFTLFKGIEAKRYLDSPASLPVVLQRKAWYSHLGSTDAALHEIMCDGIGLEPVVRQPDWDATSALFKAVRELNDPRPHLR